MAARQQQGRGDDEDAVLGSISARTAGVCSGTTANLSRTDAPSFSMGACPAHRSAEGWSDMVRGVSRAASTATKIRSPLRPAFCPDLVAHFAAYASMAPPSAGSHQILTGCSISTFQRARIYPLRVRPIATLAFRLSTRPRKNLWLHDARLAIRG